MAAATDHDLHALTRTGDAIAFGDARLFSLIEELINSEKRRDELLDRLSVDGSAHVERAAKKACDTARAIYERIAAIKPTTGAGVLRQLELIARGWVAPATLPIAMAALRDIADRPPPLKIGRLPPVPTTTGLSNNSVG